VVFTIGEVLVYDMQFCQMLEIGSSPSSCYDLLIPDSILHHGTVLLNIPTTKSLEHESCISDLERYHCRKQRRTNRAKMY